MPDFLENRAPIDTDARELNRRSRARHPHFQVAKTRGYDPISTLQAMDVEGIETARRRSFQNACYQAFSTGKSLFSSPIGWGSKGFQQVACAAQEPENGRPRAFLRKHGIVFHMLRTELCDGSGLCHREPTIVPHPEVAQAALSLISTR